LLKLENQLPASLRREEWNAHNANLKVQMVENHKDKKTIKLKKGGKDATNNA